jgi:microcystin-dependent protein
MSTIPITFFENLIAPGTVVAFPGTTPPSGWLLCDGSAISRTAYPRLFQAISTKHGYGDNDTTFNIPDYRGRFLRGTDMGQGRDPDRGNRTVMALGGAEGDDVGSIQGQAFQSHTHAQNSHTHAQNSHSHSYSTTAASATVYPAGVAADLQLDFRSTTSFAGGISRRTSEQIGTSGVIASSTPTNQDTTATNQNAVASGTHSQASANETRPVNANTNFIIKI